jgi:hypothetical protein
MDEDQKLAYDIKIHVPGDDSYRGKHETRQISIEATLRRGMQ